MIASSNENDRPVAVCSKRAPDAHGQAALLLVKSLIHVLVERSFLGLVDAVDALGTAAEVTADMEAELGDPSGTFARSLTLLKAIGVSPECKSAVYEFPA